jgi:hypothetical protein
MIPVFPSAGSSSQCARLPQSHQFLFRGTCNETAALPFADKQIDIADKRFGKNYVRSLGHACGLSYAHS